MNFISLLICYLINFQLIYAQSIDSRLSFNMLIGNDDDEVSNFEKDKNYQNDAPVESDIKICKLDNKIYKDGNLFRSINNCEIAECNKGKILYHRQECPKLNCRQQVFLKDECCPICKTSYKVKNENLFCNLNSEIKFKASSVWYPFISPFGFDRCTKCTCLPTTLTISCKSICNKNSSKKSRSIRKNHIRRQLKNNFLLKNV